MVDGQSPDVPVQIIRNCFYWVCTLTNAEQAQLFTICERPKQPGGPCPAKCPTQRDLTRHIMVQKDKAETDMEHPT